MKARKLILFAHSGGEQGGAGQGSYDLVNSLKTELSREFHILYPIIEDPEAPTYEMWETMFTEEFAKISTPVILIGHSLGASMLLKYISEENPGISISGLFLVAAPFWGKDGWDVPDFILKENFEAFLPHIPAIYLYHSVNDSIVPFQHLSFYRKAFPSAIVREIKGTDHAFAQGLPDLVQDIKNMAS